MYNSPSYSALLPSNFTDVDGNAIETNIQYYVYVFAVYTCAYYLSDTETITINGVVGVEKHSTSLELNIFPNPSSGELLVRSNEVISRIDILDLTGRIVFNKEIKSNEVKLDISHLSAGIYYLKATQNNENYSQQKLVKK